jgi:molecular chaperone GrpE (heat shock protein)
LLTAPQDCRDKVAETRTQYEEEVASLRERASLWRAEANGIWKRSERRAETQIRTDGSSGDTVVEVVRVGYTLDGETLRAAKAIVGHPEALHRAYQDRRSR